MVSKLTAPVETRYEVPVTGGKPPTSGQIRKTAAIGIFFWFIAAMVIKFGVPAGLFSGTVRIANFALFGPLSGWLTVLFVKRVAGLSRNQLVPAITVGTSVATFCDGVALSWFPELYGSNAESVLLGAAWILAALSLENVHGTQVNYSRSERANDLPEICSICNYRWILSCVLLFPALP